MAQPNRRNQIGDFVFVSMSRPHILVKRRLIYGMSVGVSGYERWLEAARGELFQVDTFNDNPTLALAELQRQQFEASVSKTRQAYQWEGGDIWRVTIHDVQITEIREVINSVGGLFPNSRAYVRAQWTLLNEDPSGG